MAQRFPVLLVDDGELDDVRDCLLALHLDFAHLRGGAVPPAVDPPGDLFIATARRAPLARPWPRAKRPVRLAIVAEDSEALRTTLRQLGFAFLVRRPIHPVALRLLLQHALYRGEERRVAPRVPLGFPVAVKLGMRRRDALLADLGESGCRLLTSWPAAEGTKITVQVPSELCGEDGFLLPGLVVRCAADRTAPSNGSFGVAIQFSALSEAARSLLAEALEAHRFDQPKQESIEASEAWFPDPGAGDDAAPRLVRRVAPRPLPAPSPIRGRSKPKEAATVSRGRGADRRRQSRRRYGQRVVAATSDGALHRVLIGHDLSSGGMRVDRQPELAVGTRLRLALYDSARAKPVVVNALVTRDDGARGVALCFEGLEADAASRLEQLVAGLPPVECLDDGEAGSLGTIVGEILQ